MDRLSSLVLPCLCIAMLQACATHTAADLGNPNDALDIPSWASAAPPIGQAPSRSMQSVTLGQSHDDPSQRPSTQPAPAAPPSEPQPAPYYGGYGYGAWAAAAAYRGYGSSSYGAYPSTSTGRSPPTHRVQPGDNWPAPKNYGPSFPFNTSGR